MFGSEYSKHPEILLSSFGEMHKKYKRIVKKNKLSFNLYLQKIYIYIFGIPEIGFQLRSLYFKDIIENRLKSKKIRKILDAGSGIGVYGFWLAKYFPNADVVGGEIAKDKLKFSSEFASELSLSNIKFKYFDVTSLPKGKEKYDMIVNIDVLEHIENYKKVLSNFYKLLNKGGYLYIHTPQPNQKRIFNNLKNWEHEDHAREGYTPESLKDELKKLGFRIIVLKETFGFFGKLAWELNHIFLKKGFIIAGIAFPLLFLISLLDLKLENKNGLGTAILAQKK